MAAITQQRKQKILMLLHHVQGIFQGRLHANTTVLQRVMNQVPMIGSFHFLTGTIVFKTREVIR
jgi:hypothetical protein